MAARLDHLAASFGRHLRAEGRADRTNKIYRQAVRFYGAWLEAQDQQLIVDELTRASIREWLEQLADVNEPSTVKTRPRGLFRSAGGWSTRASSTSTR